MKTNIDISSKKIQELKARKLSHVIYPPDVAPNDFVVFRYIKEKMSEICSRFVDELIARIRAAFEAIPTEISRSANRQWITRLNYVMRNDRDYCHMSGLLFLL
jgi:hypothetical protein